MSKFVALPIEVKVRDFQSRLFLSLSLLKNDFEVIIGSQDAIIKNIDSLPVGVYFDKSLSKNKTNFFQKISSKGFSLVSQDEEGLCSLFNYERYITQRICTETLSLAKKVFTWGNSEAELIKERYKNFTEKVVVTGNPRIDLLTEPLKQIHQSKADRHKKNYQDYFLFPSSFTVNHAMGNENLDSFLIKMGRVQNEGDLRNYHIKQEFFKKTFLKYSSLVEEIALNYPEKNLIVRPHPSEDADHWEKIAKRYSNVFIESEGNIASWILGSEMVIHSSCTTGMEAFIMDKPVISFLPFTDHEYSKQISNTVSKVCKSIDEVKNSIDHFLSHRYFEDYSVEESKDFLRGHIKNLEQLSCEIISQEISKLDIAESDLKMIKSNPLIEFKNKLRYLKEKFSNPKSIKYAKQKLSGISLEEIKELISDLRIHTEIEGEVICQELTNDLFHLKRKS